MATYSSVLAWRILWTEKPGGLQPMGLQRVRHDWSGLACTHALLPCTRIHEKVKFIFLVCKEGKIIDSWQLLTVNTTQFREEMFQSRYTKRVIIFSWVGAPSQQTTMPLSCIHSSTISLGEAFSHSINHRNFIKDIPFDSLIRLNFLPWRC